MRSTVRYLLATILIVLAYWNVLAYTRNAAHRRTRAADELVVSESRYRGVREALRGLGYPVGPISFVTNRDLNDEPPTWEDNARWGHAQYAMVPWLVVRNGVSVSGFSLTVPTLVVADFWDGRLVQIPPDLQEIYDFHNGIVLFRKTMLP
jgi:hypothetical protein